MKTHVTSYKNYIINTEEGTEKGIFFRSPIQSAFIDFYHDHEYNEKYTKDYFEKIKNPIRKIYEILIGNRNVIKNTDVLMNSLNICGCCVKVLCSPIYFKRDYRKLIAEPVDYDGIMSIISYGYESEFTYCAGDCVIEKTKIKLKNGKTLKIKTHDQYHYTYAHIVKDIIDSGKVQ